MAESALERHGDWKDQDDQWLGSTRVIPGGNPYRGPRRKRSRLSPGQKTAPQRPETKRRNQSGREVVISGKDREDSEKEENGQGKREAERRRKQTVTQRPRYGETQKQRETESSAVGRL